MNDLNLEIVLETEADNWFSRNREKQAHQYIPSAGFLDVLMSFGSLGIKPRSFLEIGAADGYNLAHFESVHGGSAVGIEASKLAVEAGQKKLRSLGSKAELLHGSGHEIPFPNEHFEFIYLGFFLYLVSEKSLAQFYSEALRVLKPGGIIAITDFFPTQSSPSYGHDPRIKINKLNHSQAILDKFPETRLLSYKVLNRSNSANPLSDLEQMEINALIHLPEGASLD